LEDDATLFFKLLTKIAKVVDVLRSKADHLCLTQAVGLQLTGSEMKMPDRSQEIALRKTGMAASTASMRVPTEAPGMTHNHPLAIAQRRLQQEADHSPRVRQLQALQHMADGSVLQMKAFSPAVLNVAGEDHNESNARRAREQYVTHWVTDGGYWTEPDFQVNVNGAQVDADPKLLRFLRNLHVLRRLWNTLVTTRLPPPFIPEHARNMWVLTSPLIGLIANEYAGSVGDRYSGGAALSAEQGQTRDTINQGRYNQFNVARQALQGLNNLHPYAAVQRDNVRQLLEQFQASAQAMVQDLMERENLDVLRSNAMHQAAEAKSNSVGVWKIGESHVNDIRRKLQGAAPTYNLMTQQEFSDEYNRLDMDEVPD
jgi:hypothetical protein